MIRPLFIGGQVLLAAAFLTACGKKAVSDVAADSSGISMSGQSEDQFGKGFGAAFRADPLSEPKQVAETDVVPASLTDDPVDIK